MKIEEEMMQNNLCSRLMKTSHINSALKKKLTQERERGRKIQTTFFKVEKKVCV